MTRSYIDLGFVVIAKLVKILCGAGKVVQQGMGVGGDTVQGSIPNNIFQRLRKDGSKRLTLSACVSKGQNLLRGSLEAELTNSLLVYSQSKQDVMMLTLYM